MLETGGGSIPTIGLGTWTLRGDDCVSLVAGAIRSGYRHIDTAANYGNEAEVGHGLRASGVAREAIHVTTKVPRPMLAGKDFRRSVENSLKNLGLDHVDLILIHWPSPTVPLAETIGALNAVRDAGLARRIGVSNFTAALVDEAGRLSTYPLACNQVEYHPYLDQTRVLAACRRNGMALVAYCPLARAGGTVRRARRGGRRKGPRLHAGTDRAALAGPAGGGRGDPAIIRSAANRGESRRVRIRAFARRDGGDLGAVAPQPSHLQRQPRAGLGPARRLNSGPPRKGSMLSLQCSIACGATRQLTSYLLLRTCTSN